MIMNKNMTKPFFRGKIRLSLYLIYRCDRGGPGLIKLV